MPRTRESRPLQIRTKNPLLSMSQVAEALEKADAKISRAALYNWVLDKVVPCSHDVDGTPAFTEAERDAVIAEAKRRKAHRDALRLPSKARGQGGT